MRSFKREVYCYCMNSLVYLFILGLGLDYHKRGEKVMSKMKGMMMVEWAYVVHRERQNFSVSRTVHNIIRHVYSLQGLFHFPSVCVCFFPSSSLSLLVAVTPLQLQLPYHNNNNVRKKQVDVCWESQGFGFLSDSFLLFLTFKKGKMLNVFAMWRLLHLQINKKERVCNQSCLTVGFKGAF